MKKTLLIATAFVFALASCTKFEHDAEFQKVETGAPVIKAESVADTITATITAADKNTAYYSYAILEGAADPTIDPETLLSDGYADYTLASSCIDVKKSETVKVIVAELDLGETYTIYAVAASTNGVLSKVSTKEIIIEDGQAPAPYASKVAYDFTEEDSTFVAAIPFNRPIKLGDNAKVDVKGWGIYDAYNMNPTNYVLTAERASFSVSGTSLSAEGNCLYIVMPKDSYVPGMIYTFTYNAGTVISQPVSAGAKADAPCKAYKTEIVRYYYGVNAGLAIQTDNTTFQFEASDGNPTYVIYKKFGEYEFTFYSPLPIAGTEDKFASAVYTTDNSLRKYDLMADEAQQLSETAFAFHLPVEPGEGESVGFSIPADAFTDIYGNTNEAFEIESVPTGDFLFTVNADGKKVNFASGNLYWDGSNFNFEESQIAYATEWDSTHVSHFYWAKSAEVAYAKDYKCDIEDYTKVTPSDFFANNIFDGWGVLSKDEWAYLLKNNKYNKSASINGVDCILIACDDFEGTLGSSYDAAAWEALENEGVIALPVAGQRSGSALSNNQKLVFYITGDTGEGIGGIPHAVYGLKFLWYFRPYASDFGAEKTTAYDSGNCIRLVKEVK